MLGTIGKFAWRVHRTNVRTVKTIKNEQEEKKNRRTKPQYKRKIASRYIAMLNRKLRYNVCCLMNYYPNNKQMRLCATGKYIEPST